MDLPNILPFIIGFTNIFWSYPPKNLPNHSPIQRTKFFLVLPISSQDTRWKTWCNVHLYISFLVVQSSVLHSSFSQNSDLCNSCGNCSFVRIYMHLLDLLFEDCVFLNLGCIQHHVQSDYIDHSGVGWVPTTPICQEGDQSLPCGVEAAPWELSRSNTQIRHSIGPASCSSCDNSGWTTISAM